MGFERDRLKAFMDDNELSQAEMAELVGTTPATMSRILGGLQAPKPEMARKLRKAFEGLGCSIDTAKLWEEARQTELDLETAPTA